MNLSYTNALFFLPITVGPIFFLAGLLMYKYPPKEINSLYGYRTKNSMKDIERWNFAQVYSAKLMMKVGAGFTLFAGIGMFINIKEGIATITAIILMLLCCFILIYGTEKKLKKTFN